MRVRRSISRIWPAGLVVFSLAVLGIGSVPAVAGPSLGLWKDIVDDRPGAGSFPLVHDRRAAPLLLDKADYPGVLRAAGDLKADVQRVTGATPDVVTDGARAGRTVVIAGTLGRNATIDGLVKAGRINVDAIAGKWESFIIATVDKPLDGVDQALVIVGSDKRGTIYGIYEVSEQLGVSPWYWWADVPPRHREAAFVKAGTYVQGPPKVKYRGIFINDEEPAMGGWTREKFGGFNSKMYTHMFELLLRLRANFLWPAMWSSAFNADPDNPRLADEYGIVMGTSHHEPMERAHEEWTKNRRNYGNGEWNYMTNEAGVKKFFEDGVARNGKYENLVTLGIRGDGDAKMADAGGPEANRKLLSRVFADQRQILAKYVNPDVTKVPQLWAVFTEVQQYYDDGLRPPDDVTLLFCDDNVGNLRRVPTAADRKRSGGAGIYFHMDMNGGPFSYKWLNSNPLPKIWEQMNIAAAYGADRIWVANVGDLKPLEVPIEFFIRMAWDPAAMTKEKVAEYQLRWADREFGDEHAPEVADIVSKYAKYNNWRKPELLRSDTYSLTNYREAERVSQAWDDVAARATTLNDLLPKGQRDAFYELALHPARACANLVDLYVAAGRNELFAKQGRAGANAEAALVRTLFQRDQAISDYYNHELAGGRWDHMMDQTHIGYTSWQSPKQNILPPVKELSLPDTADFGVAVDGSEEAWPGAKGDASLPAFDSLNRQRSYFEVFAKGRKPITFKCVADRSWITITEGKAPGAGEDRRLWVDIDWDKARAGMNQGTITVSGTGRPVTVRVAATKATEQQVQEANGCFGGLVGPIAFLAEGASKNVAVGDVRWEKIPDYGRGPSAMSIFPVTAAKIEPPQPAPYLEYPVYFARGGTFDVQLITSPTLDMLLGRGLGVAVSIDNGQPEVVNVFTPKTLTSEMPYFAKNYQASVTANARTMHVTQTVDRPGRHVLKIAMVDPTFVLQKIIISDAKLPKSYFGPPERAVNGVRN